MSTTSTTCPSAACATAGQVKRGAVEAPKRTFNLQALKAEQARAEAAKLYRQLSEAGTRVPDSIRERTADLAKTLSVATTTTAQTQEKQAK